MPKALTQLNYYCVHWTELHRHMLSKMTLTVCDFQCKNNSACAGHLIWLTLGISKQYGCSLMASCRLQSNYSCITPTQFWNKICREYELRSPQNCISKNVWKRMLSTNESWKCSDLKKIKIFRGSQPPSCERPPIFYEAWTWPVQKAFQPFLNYQNRSQHFRVIWAQRKCAKKILRGHFPLLHRPWSFYKART